MARGGKSLALADEACRIHIAPALKNLSITSQTPWRKASMTMMLH
ncbi:hypothetical protein H5410_047737 [Solanum commersonii]|uniref:Uncharacterized protein n=1 Tax=Solanum commersonii TaxID=4109 RepID=A0A9J5XI76_SOLCO|nr:hypothetical protein H5410_047737 [Solanum commersonii]